MPFKDKKKAAAYIEKKLRKMREENAGKEKRQIYLKKLKDVITKLREKRKED